MLHLPCCTALIGASTIGVCGRLWSRAGLSRTREHQQQHTQMRSRSSSNRPQPRRSARTSAAGVQLPPTCVFLVRAWACWVKLPCSAAAQQGFRHLCLQGANNATIQQLAGMLQTQQGSRSIAACSVASTAQCHQRLHAARAGCFVFRQVLRLKYSCFLVCVVMIAPLLLCMIMAHWVLIMCLVANAVGFASVPVAMAASSRAVPLRMVMYIS